MKQEIISDAIGLIDDDIIESTDKIRQRTKQKKVPWKRFVAMAACLCLFVGLAVVGPYLVPLGGKCSGNLGTLVDGVYYYATDHAIYSYTPEGRNYIRSTFRVSQWKVDSYGIYYTSGRAVYVMPHETGKTQKLYQSERDFGPVPIRDFQDGKITLRLNSKNVGIDDETLIQIDGKTGEVLWQETMTWDEMLDFGEGEFVVGDILYTHVVVDGYTQVYRNGEPFLPEGSYIEHYPRYYDGNLLIRYRDGAVSGGNQKIQAEEMDDTRIISKCLLATPNGELIDVPDGDYLTGTKDFLLFIEAYDGKPYDVYCYDLNSGETTLLYTAMDIYTAATDGTWLYTCVPWSGGRTDCWKIVFDDAGKVAALELVESDI